MIGQIIGLKRQRRIIARRIASRRHRIRSLGGECRRSSREWMGSSRALLQAFLAGFFVDQARPLLPSESSPVKIALIILFRRLESLIVGES
jgi:hypothetical protein